MGKRLSPLLLALALLLSACAPAASGGADFTADQVLQTALAACPDADDSQLHTLSQEELADYIPARYGLEDGQWTDAAIAIQEGMSAFEVGVLLLEADTDGQSAQESLETYRSSRQGDFTGYAPDQAALAEQGQVLLLDRYLILLICQDPDSAAAAVEALLAGETAPVSSPSGAPAEESAPLTSSSPAPSDDLTSQSPPPEEASEAPADESETPTGLVEPSPSPSAASPDPTAPTSDPAADRYPYTDPNIDDMTIYDTDPILAAWRSGDRSALGEKDAAILAAAEEVLQEVTDSGMDDYETERAVYRWLVENVDYDWTHQSFFQATDPDSSDPYGALVDHTAICLGFATAFQLLMDMSGVECITVVGAAYGSSEDHAWNMVRLDGEWYCVDATWDIGVPEAYWSYFNVTSDYMAATDHQWDYASVPEATAADGGRG